MTTTLPVLIGWCEWAVFPEWRAVARVKIDTGARSSTIDCENIEQLNDQTVRFTLRLTRCGTKLKTFEAPIARIRHVRSSNGHSHARIFISTPMEMAGRKKNILISLSNRPNMIHRILIGREALAQDYVVDVSQRYMHPKQKQRVD